MPHPCQLGWRKKKKMNNFYAVEMTNEVAIVGLNSLIVTYFCFL